MLQTFGLVVVLGFLSLAGGSYATDATKCADEDSCDNEVSSLLQLPPRKMKSSLSAQGKTEGRCPEVGARAYVTSAALGYVTEQLFPFAYTDIQDGLVPMDSIIGAAAGFDYAISRIKLLSFAASSAVFEFVEGRGIKVHVADVALSAIMDYKLSSNSFWTSLFPDSQGVLSATIGSGSMVSLTVVLGPNGAPTNITFGDIDTQLNVNTLNFNAPGSFDSFLNVLTSIFMPLVRGFLQDAVTELVAKQSFDVAAKIDDALGNSSLPFPLQNETGPFPYDVDVRVCGFGIGSDHVAVNAYALVDTPANGVYNGQGYDLDTTEFTPDHSTMIGVGATEWTVNGFVWLARTVGGSLPPASASPGSSGAVRLRAEPGTLEDGRDLKVVAQESAKHVANQLQVQVLDEVGVSIGDLSLHFFNQALGAVADIELDLKKLLDHILGEEVHSHMKLGAVAAEEHDRIDPPAASPAAVVPAVVR